MGFFDRNRKALIADGIDPARLPPGQYRTDRWPVLHEGQQGGVGEHDIGRDLGLGGRLHPPLLEPLEEGAVGRFERLEHGGGALLGPIGLLRRPRGVVRGKQRVEESGGTTPLAPSHLPGPSP